MSSDEDSVNEDSNLSKTPLPDLNICFLSVPYYADMLDWKEFLDSGKTLDDMVYDKSWIALFASLRKEKQYNSIITDLKKEVDKNKHQKIYPKPEYVFSAFLITPADTLKVVFIGQDPYFTSVYCSEKNRFAPQAMGLSFSVADGIDIPSSLQNIYRNQIKYGHIKKMPKSGNLWFWASQGCLMLNTALTVKHDDKKSHTALWQWMTNEMIKYISEYFSDIVFVLWGGDAYQKINLINQDKHHTIISSHPSGLSAHKPFGKFPAFNDFDHFGEINKILKNCGKTKIIW